MSRHLARILSITARHWSLPRCPGVRAMRTGAPPLRAVPVGAPPSVRPAPVCDPA